MQLLSMKRKQRRVKFAVAAGSVVPSESAALKGEKMGKPNLGYVGQKVIILVRIPGHKRFKLEAPMNFTNEKVAAAIAEIMEQREESGEKPFDPIKDNPMLIERDKRWKEHEKEMKNVFM